EISVYVTEATMRRVAALHGPRAAARLRTIRCGSLLPADLELSARGQRKTYEILYLGDFAGWHACLDEMCGVSRLRRVWRGLNALGRHVRKRLDYVAHSPLPVARALRQAIRAVPEASNRVHLRILGSSYDPALIDRVLQTAQIADLVRVEGKVPYRDAIRAAHAADGLFLSLPGQPAGGIDHRISSKTYDYLTTDLPILAALPPGANRDLLQGIPGVFLVGARDEQAMAEVLTGWLRAWFVRGEALRFPREQYRELWDYQRLARQFSCLVHETLQRNPVA
ncbi:MAG: hypothetical protein NZ561_11025, partial [Phycisphaerae bacterium]|nr:hypothetical protein [Phycisphaerae bacterium]